MDTCISGYINGSPITGLGHDLQVVDPTTGKTQEKLAEVSIEQVDAAVQSAHDAFPQWSNKTPLERSNVLMKLAHCLEENFGQLAEVEAKDTGKPIHKIIQDERHHIIDPYHFFAGAVRTLTAPATDQYVEGTTSFVRYEPMGVVALIAPWNYPLMMASWKIAPALAAGNTVVLKPSEETPLATLQMAALFNQILPKGVLNVVHGTGANVGAPLVAHPKVRLVSLTGDIATGAKVAGSAAQQIKPSHLELGGKAPVLIFPDADLEKAAKTVASTGFYNAGQDCTAACRVFVHTDVAEEFTSQLLRQVKKLKVGEPDKPDQDYGPLVSEKHLKKVLGFLERAKECEQIKCLTGGYRYDRPGFYVAPTVLAHVPFEHECVQKEIFGPVVTVSSFSDEKKVVEIANETEYGLSCSVFTNDLSRAMNLQRQLQYGCVWVNTHLLWPTEMPHGGYKQSGMGKEMSIIGLKDYMNIKHVLIQH